MSNPPVTMYGVAKAGDKIEALIRGEGCQTVVAGTDGFWVMQVPEGGPGLAKDGDTISFRLNGAEAAQIEIWKAGGAPSAVSTGVTLSPAPAIAPTRNTAPASSSQALPSETPSVTAAIDLRAMTEQLQTWARIAGAVDWDEDLWAHVGFAVDAQRWAQAASLAATYVEDTLRTRARVGLDAIGADLATKVFGKNGTHRLGFTDGEMDGWHQLARGFLSGPRNTDSHRIQNRADLKRYALGVLGTANLILTQLRYQHPPA